MFSVLTTITYYFNPLSANNEPHLWRVTPQLHPSHHVNILIKYDDWDGSLSKVTTWQSGCDFQNKIRNLPVLHNIQTGYWVFPFSSPMDKWKVVYPLPNITKTVEKINVS
jgi:hypothetical protein